MDSRSTTIRQEPDLGGNSVHLPRGSTFFTFSRSAFTFGDSGFADFVPPVDSEVAAAFFGSGDVLLSPQPVATIDIAATTDNHMKRLFKFELLIDGELSGASTPREEKRLSHCMASESRSMRKGDFAWTFEQCSAFVKGGTVVVK